LSFRIATASGANAVEQLDLALDAARVEVQRGRDLFLGDTALDRFQDHPVLLNGRDAADALVVGEGLVVGRHEAFDLFLTQILQDFDPDMSVEQQPAAIGVAAARNHWRLDQSNLPDRCGDLSVFSGWT
jgi:hypothetical protein